MNRLAPSLLVTALVCLGAPLGAETTPKAKASKPTKGTTPGVVKPLPPEVAKLMDEAYADMQKKAYAAALPRYEKALALAPNRAEVWNEYAICLRDLRRLPASARAGWRAIQLDGDRTPQLWNAQANTFIEAGEWRAARACLERLESLQKDRVLLAKAWLSLVFHMLAARETQDLVELCTRATRLDPNNSLAWIDLGQVQVCVGADLKTSSASFEKGRALAEQQKDVQRADYADQLLKKAKVGESIWPSSETGLGWQTLPEDLLVLPKADATQIPLPAKVEHRYPLDEGSLLALHLPESWTESFDKPRPDHRFAVRYTVAGQEGFKAFLYPIKGIGNPLGVWSTAEQTVKRLKDGAAETDLKPLPLTSTSSATTGCWILSTDKKSVDREPAKGEYRHLLTVLFDIGRQQCVGSVLTNSKAPEVVGPCLEAFGSARRIEPIAKH